MSEFECLEDHPKKVRVMIQYSGGHFGQVVNYPIIVEAWEKKHFGKGRREYLAQFTESERSLIGRYHTQFRRWYLVTGAPRSVVIRSTTLRLLVRAVHFFATI